MTKIRITYTESTQTCNPFLLSGTFLFIPVFDPNVLQNIFSKKLFKVVNVFYHLENKQIFHGHGKISCGGLFNRTNAYPH